MNTLELTSVSKHYGQKQALAALLSYEAKEILDQMREKQLELSVANDKKAFIYL